jgi:hypothetical protein
LADRVPLMIVYLLVRRVLSLAVLLSRRRRKAWGSATAISRFPRLPGKAVVLHGEVRCFRP